MRLVWRSMFARPPAASTDRWRMASTDGSSSRDLRRQFRRERDDDEATDEREPCGAARGHSNVRTLAAVAGHGRDGGGEFGSVSAGVAS